MKTYHSLAHKGAWVDAIVRSPIMGNQQILESINDGALKSDLPRFDVGDTLAGHRGKLFFVGHCG